MTECAVWYMRYGGANYELCDSEEDAVRYAYALAESEEGSVMGVQFADGRLVERDQWQALTDYVEQRWREWRDSESKRSAAPPPPSRRVRDPFDGQQVAADADVPDWLGA